MDIEKNAEKYFNEGYNCAQAVFKALKDNVKELENTDEMIFAGFGGGFARRGAVCGAVSAATAAISALKVNRGDIKDRAALYKLLGKFYDEFKKDNGSINCMAITKLNFSKPEDAEKYKNEVHSKVCVPLVKNTAKKVYEIIKQ